MSPVILALRPKTLTAAIVPVFVGHCLTLYVGKTPLWWITICCLGSAICIQVATNFLNDAIDFKKGADTNERIGPKRATQSGMLSEGTVLMLGFLFLFLAVMMGLPLVFRGGVPILCLGLVSLFLAYGYTGGPFPLAYLGLGDVFVILFFGVFAVCGTYFLQTQTFSWLSVGAGLQVGFLATVLIAINNLRDSATDIKVHKKTLAVRFGDNFVRVEIGLLLLFTYVLNGIYQRSFVVWITILTLPLAILILKRSFKAKTSLNTTLGLAGLLQLIFGTLLSIGLVAS